VLEARHRLDVDGHSADLATAAALVILAVPNFRDGYKKGVQNRARRVYLENKRPAFAGLLE